MLTLLVSWHSSDFDSQCPSTYSLFCLPYIFPSFSPMANHLYNIITRSQLGSKNTRSTLYEGDLVASSLALADLPAHLLPPSHISYHLAAHFLSPAPPAYCILCLNHFSHCVVLLWPATCSPLLPANVHYLLLPNARSLVFLTVI